MPSVAEMPLVVANNATVLDDGAERLTVILATLSSVVVISAAEMEGSASSSCIVITAVELSKVENTGSYKVTMIVSLSSSILSSNNGIEIF